MLCHKETGLQYAFKAHPVGRFTSLLYCSVLVFESYQTCCYFGLLQKTPVLYCIKYKCTLLVYAVYTNKVQQYICTVVVNTLRS